MLNLCVGAMLWVTTFAECGSLATLTARAFASTGESIPGCSSPVLSPQYSSACSSLCVCWHLWELVTGAVGSTICSTFSLMGSGCGTRQGLQSQFALHFCEGAPINVMFLAPGVSPWKTTLPGVSNGANNPAIRVIDYDQDTLQVLVGDLCVHHTAALEQL